MEEQIIRKYDNTPSIDLLRCYEPGNEQFQQLKKVRFGQPLKKVHVKTELHLEAFDGSTDLGSLKFDVVTMLHVHYYWTSSQERKDVMENVFKHLNPGGIVFILMLEKVSISCP